jgi:hypothetical protein
MTSGTTATVLAVIMVLGLPFAGQAGGDETDVGRRLFRDGILPNGGPIEATLRGAIPVRGKSVACANCHRRSGFGTGEGEVLVPLITGPALFNPASPNRSELLRELYQEIRPDRVRARFHYPNPRPAYTSETLARAIRAGTDPAGRALDAVMPRYALDDTAMAALTGYLRGLSATTDPGVDDTTIHFATVIDVAIDPARRDAMLDVIKGYTRWRNLDIQRELARPGHSPLYRDITRRALRTWKLHVWTVSGPPGTWRGQLRAAYAKQPVFAVLGGISDRNWAPVHGFCDDEALPCLFPLTPLPVIDTAAEHGLYLDQGLPGAARALARHLGQTRPRDKPTRIVQVFNDAPIGRIPAAAFRLAASRRANLTVEDHQTGDRAGAVSVPWHEILSTRAPRDLVIWLVKPDLSALKTAIDRAGEAPSNIFLPYRHARGLLATLPPGLRSRVRVIYPHALPGERQPRQYRARAWLRSRRIERAHEEIQLKTWLTMEVVNDALGHMLENFHRDYLVEIIEHRIENEFNPGLFPRLSLGPGQRFASKGWYITRPGGPREEDLEAVSGWIVP